nr:hypothetical protein [Pedobacter sp. ASV19]
MAEKKGLRLYFEGADQTNSEILSNKEKKKILLQHLENEIQICLNNIFKFFSCLSYTELTEEQNVLIQSMKPYVKELQERQQKMQALLKTLN